MVWHYCLKSDCDKLEKLNERALRSVFQDKENDYRYLSLNKADNHKLQNIAILIYKAALINIASSYIKDLFQ